MQDIRITISTAQGDLDLTVYASKTPLTAANFLNLASRGFYNGTIFHRVIKNFMVQGGDPKGTGTGGPGYQFGDEVSRELTFNRAGLLAMANAGPGTNGSQFFITHGPTPHLNMKHTIFGELTKGQDVVDTLPQGCKIESITIHDSTDELFAAQADQIAVWNQKLGK